MKMKQFLTGGLVIGGLVLAACAPAGGTATLTPGTGATSTSPVLATSTPLATEPVLGTETPMMTPEGTATAVTTPATTGTAVTTPAGTETPAADQPLYIRASDLVGMTLEGVSGGELGEITDVLVDPATGEIQYLVFDATGLNLGDDRRWLPVTWQELEIQPGDERLTYTGTETELKEMPALADDVYNEPGFVWDQPITGTTTTADQLIRVGRFTDFDLRNAADEDLGEVEELVVDLRSGVVTHAIVNFGGFLGIIGEETVVVPWDRFSLLDTGTTQVMQLDVTKEALENAPTVDNLDELLPPWPETIRPNWDRDLTNFWQTAGSQ